MWECNFFQGIRQNVQGGTLAGLGGFAHLRFGPVLRVFPEILGKVGQKKMCICKMEEYYLKIAKHIKSTFSTKIKCRKSTYTPFIDGLDMVSHERLTELQKSETDLPKARHLDHNDNRFTYDHESVEHCSGMFLYPPGGYCGWHTNSDTPGERIYISWCKDAKKSFFRYIDSFTGEMVTKYESQGWNVNRFQIPGDALLWHCVYSDTVRFSIGFHTVTGIHACTLSKAGDWRLDGRDRFLRNIMQYRAYPRPRS